MTGAAEEAFPPLTAKEVVAGCPLSLSLPVSHGFRQPYRLLLAGVMVLAGCNPAQPRTSALGPTPSPVPTATAEPFFPDPGTTAVPVEPPPSTPQPQLGEPPRAQ